jgi:hypothetical protein
VNEGELSEVLGVVETCTEGQDKDESDSRSKVLGKSGPLPFD